MGDIADEFDEETVARRDAERIWIVPGTMRQDELTRLTGMPFPDDTETETVSGWIVECLGRLVQEGDTVVTGHGWKLRVVTVEGLRAGEVEVRAPADHHAQAVS
ncbi:MAG: transporter associated domain-containing protein [Nitriliruptoraceae bacterium]